VKYLPWVVAALLLFAGWSWHERKVGELNGRIAHLVLEKARVDTFYRTQTKTLVKVRLHTDSMFVTDTVIHTDTVRLLLAAERNACNAVIKSCEDRVAYRDSIIEVLKKKPSVWSKVPWVLGGVVAGVVLTR
jgi:hypothetical protein